MAVVQVDEAASQVTAFQDDVAVIAEIAEQQLAVATRLKSHFERAGSAAAIRNRSTRTRPAGAADIVLGAIIRIVAGCTRGLERVSAVAA